MSAVPETRYARSGDLYIAYSVSGEGPLDIIFVPPAYSHLELLWEYPAITAFLRRWTAVGRLILFDKRGSGLSSPVPGRAVPTAEEWMDDVEAVVTAANSERHALIGWDTGGPVGMLYAATHPERVVSLTLISTYARLRRAPDYAFGMPDAAADLMVEIVRSDWGCHAHAGSAFLHGRADDSELRDWYGRLQRFSMDPGTAVAAVRAAVDLDVRDVLPAIQAPTLIVQAEANPYVRTEYGRYLAEHIAGARYVGMPIAEHYFWLSDIAGESYDVIEEFITGTRRPVAPDRVLATVLFTDLVGSTERAAAMGDRRWRAILDAYDGVVARALDGHRGKLVKTTGDGVLATFDGPGRAIECSLAMRDEVRHLGLEQRAGLHTGEVELRGDDVGGIAVNIASRVMDVAGPGEVVVSRTVKDLVVGSGVAFEERGVHVLKGVPDRWDLFAVAER